MKNLYRSNLLLGLVTALTVCLVILDIALFRDNKTLFWISLPILLTVAGFAIGKLFQIRKNEYAYYDWLGLTIGDANQKALDQYPLPMAVVSKERRILSFNNSFALKFFHPDDDHSSIDEVLTDSLAMLEGDGREIVVNGRWYIAKAIPLERGDAIPDSRGKKGKRGETQDSEEVSVLFFEDITSLKDLQDEHRKSKPVVAIISVDNYDETVGNNRESEKTIISAQIDKLLENYFSRKNAVLRKISGDKFIVVLEDRYVQEMADERVKLLEEVRQNIKLNDRTPVTLSIGVGRTAFTLAESESFAWEALNKAIGRGGDQAVIRNGAGYDYFGAETQRTERNSGSVRTRITADRIKALMNSADKVYIMGHSYGDYDSVGAAIGLAAALRRMGKDAYACISRELDSSGNRRNLSENLLQRFDRPEDEPQLYEPSLFLEPKVAALRFNENSLLFIVDTHIEKKVESRELYEKADPSHIVVIDHHRKADNEIQAAISWVDANASSASEMVTDLLQYFGDAGKLQPLEAEALLAGITLDTKDFVMRTGEATFEAAARLKKCGANTILVKELFATSKEDRIHKSQVVAQAYFLRGFAVSIVEESFSNIRVVCSQAADEMLNITGVDASVTVYPIENGWSYSARSLGKVNVQVLMENIGNKKDDGGGHLTMAGAQLYNITKEEAVQKLEDAIESYYNNLSQE